MLSLSPCTRVSVALGATDMRKSFDTLMALVSTTIEQDPLSGHLFVFASRTRTRIKVLAWDGSGLWVMAKRLDQGTFAWPKISGTDARAVTLTSAELSMLLSEIDLAQSNPRRWYRRASRPRSARERILLKELGDLRCTVAHAAYRATIMAKRHTHSDDDLPGELAALRAALAAKEA